MGILCSGWPSVARKYWFEHDFVHLHILRLGSVREELRRRFIKAELALFKVRYETDDTQEREAFLQSRDFGWEMVRILHI